MLITPGLIPALQATCYLPFHTGIFSDHCAIWADFNPEILFLGDISSAIDPAAQRLKTSSPIWVDNYMDALETFFTNQNILQRVLQLEQDYMNWNYDRAELTQMYKQLDRIITEGMLSVEKA
eukprot:10932178-Ditylum_brightwellii.AAC.1